MKTNIAILILLFLPLTAYGLNCKTVETEDKIEVVCEGEQTPAKKPDTFEYKGPSKNFWDNPEIASELKLALSKLLLTNPSIDKINDIITNVALVSAATNNECKTFQGSTDSTGMRLYYSCIDSYKKVNGSYAELMLITADYFAKKGMKSKAKETYRDVIKQFTGDAYKTYIKQAEFGLEDLK